MTLSDGKKTNGDTKWEEEESASTCAFVGEDLFIELKLKLNQFQEYQYEFYLFRDDKLIPTDRYNVQSRGDIVQLTLKKVEKEDSGNYTLIAKKLSTNNYNIDVNDNNEDLIKKKIRMNVREVTDNPEEGEPPIFVRRLTDLAVKVGTRTRFLVEIRSSSTPKITWHKNDHPIQVGSRFSFIHEGNFFCIDLAPVMVEDQGLWTCMVENIYGRSTCTCCLSVIVPKAYKSPEFVEQLRAILTETGTVSLECKVVGVPTPVLRWYKDEKEIKAGDVFALTANADDPTSLGTYTCQAVNCMGTAYSSSKVHVMGRGSREGSLKPADTLKPSGPLPVFKQILKDESCRIGQSLTLTCQVKVPPWPKAITWYNKEGKVESSDKYHIIEDGLGTYTIEIKETEAMDEGEWKCVASSNENVMQFTTCYVAMSIPKNYRMPRFMESLKAVLTEEGLVSFECKVVGFPTPYLRWFKDGQELKPGDVYQLTGTNSLGSYCCIARNCMGEAKSTAELTVEDIQNQLNEEERLQLLSYNQVPKFIKGLRSCEARVSEAFTFTVQVSVSPEPTLSWYRDDELIVENEKYKIIREILGTCHLEVHKLEFIDQAEWKCVAVNDFGHSLTSCFLKLIIPKHFKKPKFLEGLRAILSEEGAVNLECKVIGVPQPVLKWYKDGVELKPGDIHRITSGQDGTCCLGTYTCEASNCMGSVSSSASLLGFEDKVSVRKEEQKEPVSPSSHDLVRNLSLSTIHEERTSQMYDTPQTDHSVTLDDRGEVSFSFDGKEVSVSLYETPDLTEEEAIQIVEMYADQLSEHITEGNVIELPPMRFMKETSTSGNLLMEAVVIDVSPDYFAEGETDDLRTEADVEDVSIMDDQMQSILSSYSLPAGDHSDDRTPVSSPPPPKPSRKKRSGSASSKSEKSDHKMMDISESYHSAKEPSLQAQLSLQSQDSFDAFENALSSEGLAKLETGEMVESLGKVKTGFTEQEIASALAESMEVGMDQSPKKRKRKKRKSKDSKGETPSLSSKASSDESYTVAASDSEPEKKMMEENEKNERRDSPKSKKGKKKRKSQEEQQNVMIEDVRVEVVEKLKTTEALIQQASVSVEQGDLFADEMPVSSSSAFTTAGEVSEKSVTKSQRERLYENINNLYQPITTLRSTLIDLSSTIAAHSGSSSEIEEFDRLLIDKIIRPIENLCEQMSAIETKAIKTSDNKSLTQKIRILLLDSIGGPTEELLRGIELIKSHKDKTQEELAADIVVLESLTDPVDEIFAGLAKIEFELRAKEGNIESFKKPEKPIILERMVRTVSKLGINLDLFMEKVHKMAESSQMNSVSERLQSTYDNLEAFIYSLPLDNVTAAFESNVDTLVVETLLKPLENLTNTLELVSSNQITEFQEKDVTVLKNSVTEVKNKLETLTVALETYEIESGEQGVTQKNMELIQFLNWSLRDTSGNLDQVIKEKKVKESESESIPTSSDDEWKVEAVPVKETVTDVPTEIKIEMPVEQKGISSPSESVADVKIEKEERDQTDAIAAKRARYKHKIVSLDSMTAEIDESLPLPEMLLDPLIDVQAKLNEALRHYESKNLTDASSTYATELSNCVTILRDSIASSVHVATSLKVSETLNSLIDLREPLLDLQLALSSEPSLQEINLLEEMNRPLSELNDAIAAVIRSSAPSEPEKIILKQVSRMTSEILEQLPKISERKMSLKSSLSVETPLVAKLEAINPPEAIATASLTLSGIHFALATALEKANKHALMLADNLDPADRETSITPADRLAVSIENLREAIGNVAIGLASPSIPEETTLEYNYEVAKDELMKLQEPLMNFQKILLTENHDAEVRHVLNEVPSPLRKLKEVVLEVCKDKTIQLIELLEDVEKDVSLIAMEALKKSVGGKDKAVESSVPESAPGEVPKIVSKWLDPIETWLTTAAEELDEKAMSKCPIVSVVEDLKRQLLQIAIQSTYSEPPSDTALIEQLATLQEPLSKVHEMITTHYESNDIQILESLVLPTNHLLEIISEISPIYKATSILQPVFDVLRDLENQIPLSLQKATYEKDLKKVVDSMTPQERVSEDGKISEIVTYMVKKSSVTIEQQSKEEDVDDIDQMKSISQILSTGEKSGDDIVKEEQQIDQTASSHERVEDLEGIMQLQEQQQGPKDGSMMDGDTDTQQQAAQAENKIAIDEQKQVIEAENKMDEAINDQQRSAEAKNKADEAINEKQQAAQAENKVGEAIDGQQQVIEAESKMDEDINEQQRSAEAESKMGEVINEQQRCAEAKNKVDETINGKQQAAQAENKVGKAIDEQQQVIEAESKMDEDINEQQRSAEAESKMDEVINEQQRYAEAKNKVDETINEQQQTAQAENKMGEAIDEQQQAGKAESKMDGAIDKQQQATDVENKMDVDINEQQQAEKAESKMDETVEELQVPSDDFLKQAHLEDINRIQEIQPTTSMDNLILNEGNLNTEDILKLRESQKAAAMARSEELDTWTLTILHPLNNVANAVLSLDRSLDEESHAVLCRPIDFLQKQIELMQSQINRPASQSLESDIETIIEGALSPINQFHAALKNIADRWKENDMSEGFKKSLGDLLNSCSDLTKQLATMEHKLADGGPRQSIDVQKADLSLIETITATIRPLQDIQNVISDILNEESHSAKHETVETVKIEITEELINKPEEKEVKKIEEATAKPLQELIEAIVEPADVRWASISPETMSSTPTPVKGESTGHLDVSESKEIAQESLEESVQCYEVKEPQEMAMKLTDVPKSDSEIQDSKTEVQVIQSDMLEILNEKLEAITLPTSPILEGPEQFLEQIATTDQTDFVEMTGDNVEGNILVEEELKLGLNQPAAESQGLMEIAAEEVEDIEITEAEVQGIPIEIIENLSEVSLFEMKQILMHPKTDEETDLLENSLQRLIVDELNLVNVEPSQYDEMISVVVQKIEDVIVQQSEANQEHIFGEIVHDIVEQINQEKAIVSDREIPIEASDVATELIPPIDESVIQKLLAKIPDIVTSELDRQNAISSDSDELRENIEISVQKMLSKYPEACDDNIFEESVRDVVVEELQKLKETELPVKFSKETGTAKLETEHIVEPIEVAFTEEIIHEMVVNDLQKENVHPMDEVGFIKAIETKIQNLIISQPESSRESITHEDVEELIVKEIQETIAKEKVIADLSVAEKIVTEIKMCEKMSEELALDEATQNILPVGSTEQEAVCSTIEDQLVTAETEDLNVQSLESAPKVIKERKVSIAETNVLQIPEEKVHDIIVDEIEKHRTEFVHEENLVTLVANKIQEKLFSSPQMFEEKNSEETLRDMIVEELEHHKADVINIEKLLETSDVSISKTESMEVAIPEAVVLSDQSGKSLEESHLKPESGETTDQPTQTQDVQKLDQIEWQTTKNVEEGFTELEAKCVEVENDKKLIEKIESEPEIKLDEGSVDIPDKKIEDEPTQLSIASNEKMSNENFEKIAPVLESEIRSSEVEADEKFTAKKIDVGTEVKSNESQIQMPEEMIHELIAEKLNVLNIEPSNEPSLIKAIETKVHDLAAMSPIDLSASALGEEIQGIITTVLEEQKATSEVTLDEKHTAQAKTIQLEVKGIQSLDQMPEETIYDLITQKLKVLNIEPSSELGLIEAITAKVHDVTTLPTVVLSTDAINEEIQNIITTVLEEQKGVSGIVADEKHITKKETIQLDATAIQSQDQISEGKIHELITEKLNVLNIKPTNEPVLIEAIKAKVNDSIALSAVNLSAAAMEEEIQNIITIVLEEQQATSEVATDKKHIAEKKIIQVETTAIEGHERMSEETIHELIGEKLNELHLQPSEESNLLKTIESKAYDFIAQSAVTSNETVIEEDIQNIIASVLEEQKVEISAVHPDEKSFATITQVETKTLAAKQQPTDLEKNTTELKSSKIEEVSEIQFSQDMVHDLVNLEVSKLNLEPTIELDLIQNIKVKVNDVITQNQNVLDENFVAEKVREIVEDTSKEREQLLKEQKKKEIKEEDIKIPSSNHAHIPEEMVHDLIIDELHKQNVDLKEEDSLIKAIESKIQHLIAQHPEISQEHVIEEGVREILLEKQEEQKANVGETSQLEKIHKPRKSVDIYNAASSTHLQIPDEKVHDIIIDEIHKQNVETSVEDNLVKAIEIKIQDLIAHRPESSSEDIIEEGIREIVVEMCKEEKAKVSSVEEPEKENGNSTKVESVKVLEGPSKLESQEKEKPSEVAKKDNDNKEKKKVTKRKGSSTSELEIREEQGLKKKDSLSMEQEVSEGSTESKERKDSSTSELKAKDEVEIKKKDSVTPELIERDEKTKKDQRKLKDSKDRRMSIETRKSQSAESESKIIENKIELSKEEKQTKPVDYEMEASQKEPDAQKVTGSEYEKEVSKQTSLQDANQFDQIAKSLDKDIAVTQEKKTPDQVSGQMIVDETKRSKMESKEPRHHKDIPSITLLDSELESEISESSRSMMEDSLRHKRSSVPPAIEIDYDLTPKKYQESDYDDQSLGIYSATISRVSTLSPGPKDRGKKPSFCTRLTDRTAAEASRIKLTCAVLGEPEPEIYWLKNGKRIPTSSNRHSITVECGMTSLELYSVRPQDSGEYSCVAENIHGHASTEAKLKVYSGYEHTPSIPIFTRSIKESYKADENSLVLECRIRGHPMPTITWLKDGQVLTISNRYQQSDLVDGICRLKIINPGIQDSGMYTCRAENDTKLSDGISHLVEFKVSGKDRSVSSLRESSCQSDITSTDRDSRRSRFSNYFADYNLPGDRRIHHHREIKRLPSPLPERPSRVSLPKARSTADFRVHTLTASDTSDHDVESYISKINRTYELFDANFDSISTNSIDSLIDGGKPAMFISRPPDKLIIVAVGEDVSVSFRAAGIPKPRVIFMKGIRDITNGPRSYKEGHDDYVRLTLKRACPADEGTYCILLKNRYGCDRSFFTVQVKQRARSLTPSPEWAPQIDTDTLLASIHDKQKSYIKQVPGPISSEPVAVDGGRNWLSLTWGKAEQRGAAPVVAYRVDAWLLGGEGGARWVELGITPINAFDAFNLKPGEEYKFRITPRNRYGWGEPVTMASSITVHEVVKFPEFIKILPSEIKALDGTILNLECEISSDSSANIKWYRDSDEIANGMESRFTTYFNGSKCSLMIGNISEADSGRYICEAINASGRVSTFTRVQVVEDQSIIEAEEKLHKFRSSNLVNDKKPPEFAMKLKDRRVQANYPVRLTCQVVGHPEPEVTWFKYPDELHPNDNISIWSGEAHFHTLEIAKSSVEDSGIYMVKAKNNLGSTSCRCHLVVDQGVRTSKPPEFVRHLDSVYSVKTGGELRMNAQVEAYPMVEVTWNRDGHRLRPSRDVVINSNHDGTIELDLAHVTSKDAGVYCCTAANEVGKAETTARVIVLDGNEARDTDQSAPPATETPDIPYSKEPLFITKPLSSEAFEGDTVIISCEVIGDPKPEVMWLRDFLRPDYYKDAPHFRRVGGGPQYRLEIPYAKLDFTGTYSIIAKNIHGEAKAIISLQIYARGQERKQHQYVIK